MDHPIERIDHAAVTVDDIDRSCQFYVDVLSGEILFDHVVDGRSLVRGIRCGGAMLSVHQKGNGIDLVAKAPTVGSADLCFRWLGQIDTAIAHLEKHEVAIIEGPVKRFSNDGRPAQSVYFRDPDGNLLEFLTNGG